MAVTNSPLRYPGGKSSITPFLSQVIKLNGIESGVYIEPYAGGAGAAINLLFSNVVNHIVINDYDPAIYAFWISILTETDRFLQKIKTVPLDIKEWQAQKAILSYQKKHPTFDVGFAAFYLNRCNHSGILKAGPIGGKCQEGKYTLGVRFNRENLIDKISKIADHKDHIDIYNCDALEFLRKVVPTVSAPTLIYLDPPYYEKGQQLYLNAYEHEDHENLAWFLSNMPETVNWVLTYDDVPQVRALYSRYLVSTYHLNYFAHHAKKGSELLFSSPRVQLPEEIQISYGLPAA